MFKWFGNLRIGLRIIIGFFIIVALACIIGITGIVNLNNVQDSYSLDFKSVANALEYVERISSHFQQIRVNIFGFVLSADSEEEREYYVNRIAQHVNTVNENINYYYDILNSYDASEIETELKLLGNVQTAINQFDTMRKQVMEKLKEGSITSDEFVALFSSGGEAHTLASNADSAIQELIDYNVKYAADQIAENEQKAQSSVGAMIIILVVSVIFAVFMSIIISRGISGPITKVVVAAGKLAEGDMDIIFDISSKDETGKLINAFRTLVESTREQATIIERIADGDLTVDVPIRSKKRFAWPKAVSNGA